ncbi:archaeal proteasome endopeptidase complex subunit alpha [Candidatus Woesearchaeota archaeon]|nr:archaeal proteasome endopeptidase complex subunit alpha [Candidatus Woesearchaeota archaeon]
MPHQLMGYDRAITMFSPDGRLLQVEYAKKTVKQGSTAIGLTATDGVVLVTDKRIVDKLMVPESIEKIWQVDEHMGATASGILSDARVLIERSQLKAQQHRVVYGTPIDALSVVKDICNLKQICTQSGGLRPFGVSILIAAVDAAGPRLFETNPTGIYFQYKATSIGEAETEVDEILIKEYHESMDVNDCLRLALRSLYRTLKDFELRRIDAAVISTKDKQFRKVPQGELEKMFNEVKQKTKPDRTEKRKKEPSEEEEEDNPDLG